MHFRPRRLIAPLAALAASVATALVALPAPPAAHAAGPASVTLDGSGWGHGRGLSQYGAKGAAQSGLTAGEILDFYYPGTQSARAGGAITALLTADTTDNLIVGHRTGLQARSVRTGQVWSLARRGATRWMLTPVGTSTTRLWVRTDKWRFVRDIAGQAEFLAGGHEMRLFAPGSWTDYRGRLRSAVPSSGTGRDTVNIVKLETYLRGVVPVEMPASWAPAAVQAQAVAARTYAVFERTTTNRGHFDVWDTTRSQVYRGASAEHPDSDAAIAATAAVVRTHDGKPAFAQFSSSNGGWTAAGSVPYQVEKRDPYEATSGNPYNSWSVTLTDDAIERRIPAIGDFQRIVVLDTTPGGRVERVRVVGAKAYRTFTGEGLRSAFGLRSTLFRVAG